MGKFLGYLFFGVFAAAGIGIFVFGAIPMLSGTIKAASWEQIEADLIEYKLQTSHSTDSTTYKATAKYSYYYLGQRYQSNRVSFNSGSDNIGSYHHDMNAELAQISRSSSPLLIWVNPENPAEAVIDKGVRWGLFAFKSIFLLIFGGVGLIGLYVMFRNRNAGDVLPSAELDKPWTQYSEWNSATLYSNAKLGNRMMLGFALFWNLIAWPIALFSIEPILEGDYAVLLVMLFPIVGLCIFWFWFKGHRSYKHTGPMPLELNPYPASIGGQAGGIIYCGNRGAQGSRGAQSSLSGIQDNAKIVIEYVHFYVSGTGDNRRTRETVLFETSMRPSIQESERGLEIRFCFDLDNNLHVSDPPLESPRKTWRIRFSAITDDGFKIERDYDDVPVFATGQASSIDDVQAYQATSTATKTAIIDLSEAVLDLKPEQRGYRLSYPAYQKPSSLIFSVIGLVFFVSGLAIPSLVFNILFPLLGGLVFLGGVYAFANSLEVRVGAEGITSKRSLFFYSFTPEFVPSYSFDRFEKKQTSSSNSGTKTTRVFQIIAHGKEGEKAVVADRLEGVEEADAAIMKLESILNSE